MSRLPDLEGMDRDALLALWFTTFGGGAPARLSQPFLRRMLAFELQAGAQGGLPTGTRKKLEALAAGPAKIATPKMKSGGRFLREWNGVTHVVDVVEGGYLWKGERHRSLSAIAQAITGAHWSGPRFFGLGVGANGATASKAKVSKTRTDKAAQASKADAGRGGRKAGSAPKDRRSA